MINFNNLPENDNIHELIEATFDTNLPISGDWGYSESRATIVTSLAVGMSALVLEHTLASIRAHLEMNITLDKEYRYGVINVNEKTREQVKKEGLVFDKVTYEVTAIKEDLYGAFIKEYKEGYEDESLDLNDHFRRREEATLTREVVHYFEVGSIN